MSDYDQLADAIKSLGAALRGAESGQHWGNSSPDYGQMSGQARGPNPRDALRGANLGVINDEHTLELDELRGLQMLGLDRPMLARKHCFAVAIACGFGFGRPWQDKIELGAVLIGPKSARCWERRRCVLRPHDFEGRKVLIGYREQDGATCKMLAGHELRTIKRNTYYRIWLDSPPGPPFRGYPVLIFGDDEQ